MRPRPRLHLSQVQQRLAPPSPVQSLLNRLSLPLPIKQRLQLHQPQMLSLQRRRLMLRRNQVQRLSLARHVPGRSLPHLSRRKHLPLPRRLKRSLKLLAPALHPSQELPVRAPNPVDPVEATTPSVFPSRHLAPVGHAQVPVPVVHAQAITPLLHGRGCVMTSGAVMTSAVAVPAPAVSVRDKARVRAVLAQAHRVPVAAQVVQEHLNHP